MKSLISVRGNWRISIFLFFVLFSFSHCTSLLKATFESDTIGTLPDKTLPGNPTGDEILYIPEIESQLEVIASPVSTSETTKSLRYTGIEPAESPTASSTWLSFKARSSDFAKPVTFLWSGQRNFSISPAELYFSITDGSSVEAARIRISWEGTVTLINDIVARTGEDIGNLPNGEHHTISITVDLPNGVYNIGILKSSGNINRNSFPLLTRNIASYHNPARPTVSFKFNIYHPSFNYIIDDIYVKRGE